MAGKYYGAIIYCPEKWIKQVILNFFRNTYFKILNKTVNAFLFQFYSFLKISTSFFRSACRFEYTFLFSWNTFLRAFSISDQGMQISTSDNFNADKGISENYASCGYFTIQVLSHRLITSIPKYPSSNNPFKIIPS